MDLNTFIAAAISGITGTIIEECIEGVRNLIKTNIKRTSLLLTEDELRKNLEDEIRKTARWAYYDLYESNYNSDIQSRYVPLNLLLTPHKERSKVSERSPKRSLKDIISEDRGNTVILGQPGSGKTTSVKYLVNCMIQDPDFLKDTYRLPIVIRLRELNKSNVVFGELQSGGILEKLSMIFGLKFKIDYIVRRKEKDSTEAPIDTTKEDDAKLKILLNSKIIPFILDQQRILLILDGFDEIMDEQIKDLVISEIQDLTNRLDCINFILTSRTVDYELMLERTHVYEISELNADQIKDFSYRWFKDNNSAHAFIHELYTKFPYSDFYTRPLLLTQLARIFDRSNEIPDKPNEIYNRIIELSLREWNEKQGLKRISKYASFNVDRKRKFLSAMAYKLSTRFSDRVYNHRDLYSVYRELHIKFPELPIEEVREVISEIESHNGLMIQSAFDQYEFSHLTIQEYLTGDYISRSNSVKTFRYEELIKLPNELAVALSNNPYLYVVDVLDVIHKGGLKQDFTIKFFNRIQLEQPEFEKEVLLLVAILSLYTKVCKKYIDLLKAKFREENFLTKIRKVSDDIELIEDAVSRVINKDITALEEFYKPGGNIKTSDLSLIVYEKKVKTDEILGYSLPSVLYINPEIV